MQNCSTPAGSRTVSAARNTNTLTAFHRIGAIYTTIDRCAILAWADDMRECVLRRSDMERRTRRCWTMQASSFSPEPPLWLP